MSDHFPFPQDYIHTLSESMYACASVYVFGCYISVVSVFKRTFTEATVHHNEEELENKV